MISQQALISILIAVSEELVKLAEADDWEAFSVLEFSRQTKMEQLIQLNEKLGNICREQRSETMTELQTLTAGNKAKKAYS